MEHQHMWICAHTKRSQTGNCLSTVQRSPGGQWLLWQHNPVCQGKGLLECSKKKRQKVKLTKKQTDLTIYNRFKWCPLLSWNMTGYGTLSAGRVCESWKVTRSLCGAFALTTKGLSAVLMMGQSCTHTHTHLFVLSDIWHVYFTRLSLVPVCSKIKVWDLQAALDPRAPASTLCLRTLVVRDDAVLLAFVCLIDMKSDTVTSWMFGQSEPGVAVLFLNDTHVLIVFFPHRSIREECSGFSLMSFRSSAVPMTTPFWSGISWTSPLMASQRGGLRPAPTRIFLDSRYKS